MTCIHVHYIARLMSGLWVGDKRIRKWVLPRRSVDGDCSEGVQVLACGHFQKKYDTVQKMIQQIGCMDELLSGECSFDVFEHPRHHHFEWSLNGIHHHYLPEQEIFCSSGGSLYVHHVYALVHRVVSMFNQ